MANVSVKDLAKLIGLSPDSLLEKLHAANIECSDIDSMVDDAGKQKLITFLKAKKTPAAASKGVTPTPRRARTSVAPGAKVTITKKRTRVRKKVEEEAPASFIQRADEVVHVPEPTKLVDDAPLPSKVATKPKVKSVDESTEVVDLEKAAADIVSAKVKVEDDDKAKVKKSAKKGRSSKKNEQRKINEAIANYESDTDDDHISMGRVSKRRVSAAKAARGQAKGERLISQSFSRPVESIIYEVAVPESISVAELSKNVSDPLSVST